MQLESGARRLLLGDWSRLVRDPIDLLRLAVLGLAILSLVEGDLTGLARLAFTFVIVLLPRWFAVPRPFDLAFVLAMIVQGLGYYLGLFQTIGPYDLVVHALVTLSVAPLIYLGLLRLDAVPELQDGTSAHNRLGILVITTALGLSAGAVYEVYEWSANNLFGASYFIGYADTIGDLVVDALAAAAGGALLVVWATFGWSTTRRAPAREVPSAES